MTGAWRTQTSGPIAVGGARPTLAQEIMVRELWRTWLAVTDAYIRPRLEAARSANVPGPASVVAGPWAEQAVQRLLLRELSEGEASVERLSEQLLATGAAIIEPVPVPDESRPAIAARAAFCRALMAVRSRLAASRVVRPDPWDDRACCFTGHRPKAFPWGDDRRDLRWRELTARIDQAVAKATDHGIRRFICGNARGVDTWAAEAVLRERILSPDVRLEVAVPYPYHNWDDPACRRVRAEADRVHAVSGPGDHDRAYRERDRYMVDSSVLVIAVFDEARPIPGGTARTVEYSRQQGKEILLVPWADLADRQGSAR